MGEGTRLRLMFGGSMVFVAIGLLMLWTERDVSALFVTLFFGGCAGVFAMQLQEGTRRVRKSWPELDGNAITLRRAVWPMRLYALAAILLGLGGGAMVFADTGIVGTILGVVGLLFFGGGGLYLLAVKGRGPSVALRADAKGIGFGTGAHPRLRWHELADFGIVSIHGEKHLGFLARDPAQVRAGQGALARMGTGLGESLGLPDFTVAQIGLDVPLELVVDAMRRLHERHA